MEQQRPSDDQEMLSSASEMRWKVQNQLYAFIIGRFEDDLEGHHAELKDMTPHENPYAIFLIGQISEKFASWFDTLTMTVKSFTEQYHEQPQKVLEALIGSGNIEQYLRDLEDRFKVSLAQGSSSEIPVPRYSQVRISQETRGKVAIIINSEAPVKLA